MKLTDEEFKEEIRRRELVAEMACYFEDRRFSDELANKICRWIYQEEPRVKEMIDITALPPFLANLLGEIEKADPLAFTPPHEAKPSDKVRGVPHPWTLKIAALHLFYCREVEQAELDHKYSNADDCAVDHVRIQKMKGKRDILEQMKWACCREEFSLWTAEAIGFRKEWTLVTFEAPKNPMDGLLRQMFGE